MSSPVNGEAEKVSSLRRLTPAEIWSGNERTASLLELPGLVAWVYSTPAGDVEAGGDIHYVSLCPSGIVSRVALADVSGHGLAVRAFSEQVRELLRLYLTALGQSALMRDLNSAVRVLDGVHYATMVALGWHSRRQLLMVTNAGHPPPCLFRADQADWSWLETSGRRQPGARPIGVALGLLEGVDYGRSVVRPREGDFVVLYSDGVTEAVNPAGEELGMEGLMNVLRGLEPRSADALGHELLTALRRFRGGRAPADDETIIIVQRVD